MTDRARGWQTTNDADDDVPQVAVRRGVLYERRRVGAALPVVVAVLGLAAAFGGEYLVVLPAVQTQLQERVTAALQGAGFRGLRVSVDGRDVTLDGTLATAADVDRAVTVVQGVDGVRVIREVHLSTPAGK